MLLLTLLKNFLEFKKLGTGTSLKSPCSARGTLKKVTIWQMKFTDYNKFKLPSRIAIKYNLTYPSLKAL